VSLDHKGSVFVGSFAANDIDFDTAAVNETMKGCMSAFRVSDGGLLWKTRVLGEIKSSPVVIAAEVWVGAYDGFVYCFDCASGHITRRCNVGAAIFSGLTVRNDGLVIFGATIHGKAFAMSTLAGEIVWETELKSPVYSTPLFNPHEHAIIVGSVGASIVSLKCDDGTVNWEVSVDKPIFSSPQWVCNSSIGEVFVVGSHDGHLRCFSSASGNLIWSTNLGSVVFASPFVYDEYIIATVTGGTIYLVGIQDGAILDSKTLPAEIYSSPVAYNGSVFVGCRDDHLHAFSLLS
jgi:acyl-CoA synthetase